MKDGYEIHRNKVKAEKLLRVWQDLHMLVVKQLEYLDIIPTGDMKTNLGLLLNADAKRYVATLSLVSRLKSTLDLFSWVFVSGPHALFYPVLHVMAESLKVPGGYWGTTTHQDWASTQGSLDTQTVWIPITNTKDNFPLEVIPGSQKLGLLDGKENGSVLEVECDGEFKSINAQFGDAVQMSGFLVHRTGKGGDGLRVAVSMRFENVMEPTFIERGYPCAQKRVVDREIKWRPGHVD